LRPLLLGRFSTPTTLERPSFGWFPDKLRRPNGCNELLYAMVIEIDGGAFNVGLCDRAKAILLVADSLSFGQNLHEVSSG
jgi:hypothetical protein